ncbi:hypothetical protein ACQPZJ_47705 [Actinoplanes sp. CA-054009]
MALRANPVPSPPTSRHHRGVVLPQWQYEVTAGGRVWYLVDAAGKKVYLMYAGTRHPKVTE